MQQGVVNDKVTQLSVKKLYDESLETTDELEDLSDAEVTEEDLKDETNPSTVPVAEEQPEIHHRVKQMKEKLNMNKKYSTCKIKCQVT